MASVWSVPLGWTLHYAAVTHSTNDDARRAARAGCADRSVFLAEEQRRGRGRLGRAWVSPRGIGLLFSLVLRRTLPPIDLTAIASISVAEAVSAVAGVSARIKWPNDLMVGDRKVCGILTEVVSHDGIRATIIGIGVNVNVDPVSAGLPPIATSLAAETGRAIARDELLRAILSQLDEHLALDGSRLRDRVYGQWNNLLWRRDQRVRVDEASISVRGIVEGLSPSGALRIRTSDGQLVEVTTGDVLVG